ncbi:hypothetical protein AMECASPLE_035724 [Ameca splendens]|uniref:Uncharacterized protein n=1 Tax=Ameca splendens TaxID=208324 RepID=A0ABV0ZHI9_9TELE
MIGIDPVDRMSRGDMIGLMMCILAHYWPTAWPIPTCKKHLMLLCLCNENSLKVYYTQVFLNQCFQF